MTTFDSNPVALWEAQVLAWATPYTSPALLASGRDPSSRQLATVSVHSLHSIADLPHLLTSRDVRLAWGSRLAVLSCEENEVAVYALKGSVLLFDGRLVPGEDRRFSACGMSLSGDGELLAAVTGCKPADSHSLLRAAWCDFHLAVIHLASGHMLEAPLSMRSPATVAWSQDCTAILVSDFDASARELVSLTP